MVKTLNSCDIWWAGSAPAKGRMQFVWIEHSNHTCVIVRFKVLIIKCKNIYFLSSGSCIQIHLAQKPGGYVLLILIFVCDMYFMLECCSI